MLEGMLARMLVFSAALIAIGCGPGPKPEPPQSLPHSDSATRGDDPELDAAVAKARGSLDSFIQRLQHPQRGEVFSVEVPFTAANGSREHLWLGDVTFHDGVFKGTITTQPVKVTQVKFGNQASAKREEVTDWMILKSGKSEGGFTVDVLLRRQAQYPKN
jgi:uncharacterized protein YegJ (DUF2314 family)